LRTIIHKYNFIQLLTFSFYFFVDKKNIEKCQEFSKYLENTFKFSNKDSIEIIGCVPDIINLTFKELEENYNLIKEFLNLDNNKTNQLIIEYPSILVKSNPDKLKKIELYFNIYLGYQKEDLKKLFEKNPLLFIIEVKILIMNKYILG